MGLNKRLIGGAGGVAGGESTDNFSVITYTGSGSTQSTNSLSSQSGTVDFPPDLVWIKDRGNAESHQLFDSIRGAGEVIESDDIAVEVTRSDSLTSFNSNGFTLGSDSAGFVNYSSRGPYVAWCWRAGGAYVTDTSGDLDADISANQDAGFSIIRPDVQTGVNQSIPHGLSQAPELIIQKTIAASQNWVVYAPSIFAPSTRKYAYLNTSSAFITGGASFGTGYVPNSVTDTYIYTPGVAGVSNYDYWFGKPNIIYAFHSVVGYQKIGSYSGDGGSNNQINLGFQPRWLMIKLSSHSGQNWYIMDDKRENTSVEKSLSANLSSAEDSLNNHLDFTSTGFTLTKSSGAFNDSGKTYIYLAIA